jgi:agmatinase
LGLPGASSIVDKTIPTFSRGELPHFAGINTFLKAPYLEDATQVGKYDVAVVGVPFDGGCTYRAGTRFGPQGIRRISALYTPYNYEKGIDLREQMVRERFIIASFYFTSFVIAQPTNLHLYVLFYNPLLDFVRYR